MVISEHVRSGLRVFVVITLLVGCSSETGNWATYPASGGAGGAAGSSGGSGGVAGQAGAAASTPGGVRRVAAIGARGPLG